MSNVRKITLAVTLVALAILPACAGAGESSGGATKSSVGAAATKPAPAPKTAAAPAAAAPAPAAPAATPQPATDEWAVLETTVGDVVLDFFEDQTPGHAENFKKLVRQGYYDNSPFHRVIAGFMAQGGGHWGPGPFPQDVGYTIPAELHPDTLPHLRGSLAAARTDNPEKRSSGSQFYICFDAQPMLDQMGYTVFGKVVKGMENVDKIAPGTGPNGSVVPKESAVVVKRAYLVPAGGTAAAPAK